jgi:hypothetical protein
MARADAGLNWRWIGSTLPEPAQALVEIFGAECASHQRLKLRDGESYLLRDCGGDLLRDITAAMRDTGARVDLAIDTERELDVVRCALFAAALGSEHP